MAVPELLPDSDEEEVENPCSEAKIFYSERVNRKFDPPGSKLLEIRSNQIEVVSGRGLESLARRFLSKLARTRKFVRDGWFSTHNFLDSI